MIVTTWCSKQVYKPPKPVVIDDDNQLAAEDGLEHKIMMTLLEKKTYLILFPNKVPLQLPDKSST